MMSDRPEPRDIEEVKRELGEVFADVRAEIAERAARNPRRSSTGEDVDERRGSVGAES